MNKTIWTRLILRDGGHVFAVKVDTYSGQSLTRQNIARRNGWKMAPGRVIQFEIRGDSGDVLESGTV